MLYMQHCNDNRRYRIKQSDVISDRLLYTVPSFILQNIESKKANTPEKEADGIEKNRRDWVSGFRRLGQGR